MNAATKKERAWRVIETPSLRNVCHIALALTYNIISRRSAAPGTETTHSPNVYTTTEEKHRVRKRY